MVLDPEVQSVVDDLKARALPPMDQSTVEERRKIINVYREFQAPAPPVGSVADHLVDGIVPVRVYKPEGGASGVLVYFHGGGWISGNLDLYDQPCRWLCHRGQCAVVSVDYRLAPERKFPGPVEDAYAAVKWAASQYADVAVGGDSSGGNLAAAVTIRARDEDGPSISRQVLIYPVLDHNFESASYKEFAEGPVLTRAAMQHCWRLYLPNETDGDNPLASPLRAGDLSHLPAATILTAEADPVRDDGERYAARLKAAGVPVEAIRYAGTAHALIHMTGRAAAARRLLDEAGAGLRQLR